jgi:5-methylphenazine-1-carboxylate 1-monooxygenase
MQVLIAGGGIGGLAAALCLHRAGVEATVFEAAAAFRPLGVGINLLPHAVRILTHLGLGSRLAEAAVATAELVYCNKFGRPIWREPRGLAAGYRWPQYSVHRGRLQMLLLDEAQARLGPERVLVGHRLTTFSDRGRRVAAEFVDRRTGQAVTREADVLVGADGIHSAVRRRFYPDEGPPRFSGRMLWRGVSDSLPFLTGRSMVMIGHARQKFVAYPICPAAAARPRPLVNWVAELATDSGAAPPERDWSRRVDRAVFAPRFAGWRFDWLDVPALIAGAAEVFEFPMSDRDPVERWSFGRVTLLGDAAHPMYPIGSNGASQAVLDAAALSEALAGAEDVPAALREYEARRLGPTAAVVQSNREMGPEVVMQMAEERAPDGFDRVEDIFRPGELEGVARRYKQVAGFDPDALNRLG